MLRSFWRDLPLAARQMPPAEQVDFIDKSGFDG
jgi:hypothetical protein